MIDSAPGRRRLALAWGFVGVLVGAASLAAQTWYEDYLEGDEALQRQDWAEAAERFSSAIELRPEPAAPARIYGMKTLDYFPYYKLGIAFFNLGELEAAVQAFDTELRFEVIGSSEVESANLRELRRQALAGEGLGASEEEISLEIARIEQEAEVLLKQGQKEEAAVALGRILAVDPDREDVRQQIEELRLAEREASLARQREERVEQLLGEARNLTEAGRLEEALGTLEQANFISPRADIRDLRDQVRKDLLASQAANDTEDRLARAEQLEREGRHEEALRLLRVPGASGDSRRWNALRERLLLAVIRDQEEAARKAEIEEWLRHVETHLEAGRLESALIDLNRILGEDPRNPTALAHLRRVYVALRRAVLDSARSGSHLPPVVALAAPSRAEGRSRVEGETEVVPVRDYRVRAVVLDDQPAIEARLARRALGGELLWRSDTERLQGERLGKLWSFSLDRSLRLGGGMEEVVVEVEDMEGLRAEARQVVRFERPWYRSISSLALLLFAGVMASLHLVGRRERRRRRLRERRFNPYIAGPPVQDESLFFGREGLIERVLQTIHNNSVLIYGERRIGKTSLLHVLERRLRELRDEEFVFVPVYVDLQGTPEDAFFESLAEQVFEELSGPLSDARPRGQTGRLSDYSFHDLVRDLRDVLRLLQRRSERKVKLVLLVDEVDELNDYDSRTNQKLRSLFMKSFAEHLVAVFAGVAIRHAWDRDGSPWYNFFEEIEVAGLQRDRAVELVVRPVEGILKVEAGLAERIVDLCECKPYRIQKLCVALVQRVHDQGRSRMTLADLEAISAVEDFGTGFKVAASVA